MSILAPQLPFVRDQNGRGTPVLPSLPPNLPFVPGNIWHVRPRHGSDVTASGKNWQSAFKSLKRALQVASANQNDVILFAGEGNSSANCTDYQSVQLDWNKDMVHLIGISSGVTISPRSRIANVAAYANAAPIFKLSANGCYIANVSIFLGTADTTPLGAVTVTGQRNKFSHCHLTGFGASTNDIPGAYSLLLDGAEENEFEFCTIGQDRIALGAQANSQLLVANVAKNNTFRDCVFKLVSVHATNHVFVRVPASSLDGALTFIRTIGVNSQSRNVVGLELTQAMVVDAAAGGDVILDPDSAFQATDVNSADTGNVYTAGASAGILVPAVR